MSKNVSKMKDLEKSCFMQIKYANRIAIDLANVQKLKHRYHKIYLNTQKAASIYAISQNCGNFLDFRRILANMYEIALHDIFFTNILFPFKGVFFFLVRLSLLVMTNPNQLCDVLLFVCSKMADETSLSSGFPLLQIEQERSEEESSVDDALALAFSCARFCSAR